ncbi:antileukoproteinase-like [Homarus americanus]|uniref:Putative crustin-like antimicrobial peptide 6 n=1 Tax=Homarus americanus TaxID=6706 RepID=A0A8J5JMM0_HOMAM|nr:antileukoproteinase-like [Homarus americanus]KAG7158891.1 putative crustin-like antimicrobial peptide 6 [Homarus americanus]
MKVLLTLTLGCLLVAAAPDQTGGKHTATNTKTGGGGSVNTRVFGGSTVGRYPGHHPSSGISGQGASCRYWCRTPQNQAYCCESSQEPASVPIPSKYGDCPKIRPDCPRFQGPPNPCSHDGKCTGLDKCCYDTCLGQHVCKPNAIFDHGFVG